MSATAKPLDAIALLKKDHDEVKAMFKEYEELGDRAYATKQKLAEKICLELTKHAIAEEEIFYPAVRADVDDADDMVDEATVEHASAKDLIAQIHSMDPHDDLYDAKVKVLGEYIDHHVKEEEEEMFPEARKAKLDFVELGERIQARKDEILEIPPEVPAAEMQAKVKYTAQPTA
ncbi:hemerythrin HHE cation binding domain-containing protein [Pseudoduganella lurida]|uniref:Hemerythrin HHE cation binding domain-containing protein n=1 Tax=Pseudoduganella lurida TaxID=1036180 RepID=A0A562RM15_9BURK|nr:hemerythrin domain-containing protein [Pseudoduganella lurida]TWI69654.1 hemerythrin HHE cation binding domain-containing protein [Pseudoduganella lurida]